MVAHGLRKRVAAVIVVMLVSAVAVPVTVVAQPEATLEGRAVLQADTFAERATVG